MNNKNHSAKRVALYGVLTALSLVFGYIEHLVPFPIGIYGIKLGLSNLVTVTVLYLVGATPALCLNFVRICLSSLLFGNAFSFAYSLCGGMLSALVMCLAKRTNKFGVVGVSIFGGVTHNIAQLAVAVIMVEEIKIAFYLPVLLITGALTGAVIGGLALTIIKNPHISNICKSKENEKVRIQEKK